MRWRGSGQRSAFSGERSVVGVWLCRLNVYCVSVIAKPQAAENTSMAQDYPTVRNTALWGFWVVVRARVMVVQVARGEAQVWSRHWYVVDVVYTRSLIGG